MDNYQEICENLRMAGRYIERDDGTLETYLLTCGKCDEIADAIEQLVKERDAAVEDLATLRHCMSCKHEKDCFGLTCNPGPNCGFTAEKWEWRGVNYEI